METTTKNLYEAMFLVDSAIAASDWEGVMADIKNILARGDAQVESIRKWDERKLTYEIKHVSRGTYILCYFRATGDKITGIERDTKLAERIMRVLILRVDHMTAEDMEKETPAMIAEKQAENAQSDENQPVEDTEESGDFSDVDENSDYDEAEDEQQDEDSDK